jgi:hypothetical protein
MSLSASDSRVTSPIVTALENAWRAIAKRHPALPAVAVVVSATSMHKGPAAWGHFAAARWVSGEATVHELFVSAEGLQRSAADVFATLLHEAAHTLNHEAGVSDTSRGGRYHNDAFRVRAEQVGITVTKDPRNGWSATALPDATAHTYRAAITALAAALRLYRHAEGGNAGKDRKDSNNGLSLACPTCGRKIRLSNASSDLGAVVCFPCYELTGDLDESTFTAAE